MKNEIDGVTCNSCNPSEMFVENAFEAVLDVLKERGLLEGVLEAANVWLDDDGNPHERDMVPVCAYSGMRTLDVGRFEFDGFDRLYANEFAREAEEAYRDERRHEDYVKSIR